MTRSAADNTLPTGSPATLPANNAASRGFQYELHVPSPMPHQGFQMFWIVVTDLDDSRHLNECWRPWKTAHRRTVEMGQRHHIVGQSAPGSHREPVSNILYVRGVWHAPIRIDERTKRSSDGLTLPHVPPLSRRTANRSFEFALPIYPKRLRTGEPRGSVGERFETEAGTKLLCPSRLSTLDLILAAPH